MYTMYSDTLHRKHLIHTYIGNCLEIITAAYDQRNILY